MLKFEIVAITSDEGEYDGVTSDCLENGLIGKL